MAFHVLTSEKGDVANRTVRDRSHKLPASKLACASVFQPNDDRFMAEALHEAERAAARGEVPVGAVLVRNGEIVARAHNLTRTDRDPTAHAEMVAIQKAAKAIPNERLSDCDLFVSLEPCAMCAGAIVQARIARVVFGTRDPKAGAFGSVLRVVPNRKLNHRPDVIEGVRAAEAARLLIDFFKARRRKLPGAL